MSFNFKDVKEPSNNGVSPFLNPGSGQVLKIKDIELKVSQNTHNIAPIFHMEGQPINSPDFKGLDGAKGPVGRVYGNGGYYLKDDNQQQQFMGTLKTIARALNKLDELEVIEAKSFEELVSKAATILRGGFARYFIGGSEFPKADGKYGVKLFFPNRNFVESLTIDEKDSSLPKFDKADPRHYKPIPKTGGATQGSSFGGQSSAKTTTDDLPF